MMLTTNPKNFIILALFAAIAFLLVFVFTIFRVPIFPPAPFLTYEPKDVIIVMSGFLFGWLPALAVAVCVSVLEMFTVSETAHIGLIMNVSSSGIFATVASVIYHRKRGFVGAVVGLIAAVVAVTGFMLLWNFLITPIHMGIPREAVRDMLLPIFLPFNLLKYGISSAVILLLYRPLILTLKRRISID